MVNAYQIATLVMLLPLASLGDRIGYRRVYLVGMALFALSSVGAMLANSLGTLIAARTVQGLGAAGIMSVNAALVRLIYPRAQLGRGMAINSMVVATSSVAGPSVAAAYSVGRLVALAVCAQPAAGRVHAVARQARAAAQPGAGARARASRMVDIAAQRADVHADLPGRGAPGRAPW